LQLAWSDAHGLRGNEYAREKIVIDANCDLAGVESGHEDKRLVGMVVPLPWPMAAVSLAFGRVRPQTIAKLPFSIEHSGTRFIMFPSSNGF